ncbi:MAG: DUF86 domain-containing protein [Armatimonadetes bacterium]|nr:DUF86 domain-containing protein [Armatimonadota bacterium]
MPRRDWRQRVQDILDCIAAVESYTAGMSAEAFENDHAIIDAVLHNVTVIGEAVAHIPEEVRARHPEVEWRRLRETRNVVAHVYFAINIPRVWRYVHRGLPLAKSQLQKLLADEGQADE